MSASIDESRPSLRLLWIVWSELEETDVEEQSSSLSYMHRVQCYRSAVKLDYLIIAFQVKRWSKDGSVKTVVFCLLKVTVTYCRSFTLYCMHIEMASAAY